MLIDVSGQSMPVRDRLAQAIEEAWQRLARPENVVERRGARRNSRRGPPGREL